MRSGVQSSTKFIATAGAVGNVARVEDQADGLGVGEVQERVDFVRRFDETGAVVVEDRRRPVCSATARAMRSTPLASTGPFPQRSKPSRE